MKYLPNRNLFFIHIPKNAGMSVRKALSVDGEASFAPMAADLGLDEAEAERVIERSRGFDHPALGRIHPSHLALVFLQKELPQTWAALEGAHSFALTREPRARFLSALMQRLKEFKDAGAIRADDPLVRDEAERVCQWLDGRGPYTEIEYIHFARQVDYVMIDGIRVVSQVLPVDRTDALTRWIAAETGLGIDIEHGHSRRQPKKWARTVQPVARFAGRNLMPRAVKKALHPLWMNSGLFASAAKDYNKVRFSDDVETFVQSYYAADAALHEEALANAALWPRTTEAQAS